MIDELLVSATPFGVRTATIASGKVVAFNAESTRAPALLGNIYMAAEGRRAGGAVPRRAFSASPLACNFVTCRVLFVIL